MDKILPKIARHWQLILIFILAGVLLLGFIELSQKVFKDSYPPIQNPVPNPQPGPETPEPPTPTSIPPTATPEPPTPTSIPPTATPEPPALPEPLGSPTLTIAPILTPEPLTGIVLVPNLHLRKAPGDTSESVAILKQGEELHLIGREPDDNWLYVKIDGEELEGWAVTKYVGTYFDITQLPLAVTQPENPRVSSPDDLPFLDFNPAVPIESRSIRGTLEPNQVNWFTFEEADREVVVSISFRPNVNNQNGHLRSSTVNFTVYESGKGNFGWPPPSDLSGVSHIGLGATSSRDRDGDLNTGDLVWRGSTLTHAARYFIRLINESGSTITYCLAPKDQLTWSCGP